MDAPAPKSALSVISVMARLNRSLRIRLLLALLIAATPRTYEKGRALNLQRPIPSEPPSASTRAVRRTAKSPAISRENNPADKICGINRDFNRSMATMQLTVYSSRLPSFTRDRSSDRCRKISFLWPCSCLKSAHQCRSRCIDRRWSPMKMERTP